MTAFWRLVWLLDKYIGLYGTFSILNALKMLPFIISRPFDRDSDCLKLNSISSWHAWRKKKKNVSFVAGTWFLTECNLCGTLCSEEDCIPVTTGMNKCSYSLVTFYARPSCWRQCIIQNSHVSRLAFPIGIIIKWGGFILRAQIYNHCKIYIFAFKHT